MQKAKFLVYLLWTIILFQAISGLGGGILLILNPEGDLLNIPVFILYGSTFEDFLIPGIILFVLLGVLPLLTFIGLINRKTLSWLNYLNIYKD